MNDQDALLANIIANPDDDTVRLIYADAIQERGELERAEFIRLAVRHPAYEFVALTKDDPFPLLGIEPGEPVVWPAGSDSTPATWGWADNEDFGPHIKHFSRRLDYAVDRGFVRAVRGTAADWLTHGKVIRSQHPVKAVTLTTVPEVDYTRKGCRLRGYDADVVWFDREQMATAVGECIRAGWLRLTDDFVLLHLHFPGIKFSLQAPPAPPAVVLSLDIETTEDPRQFRSLIRRVNSTPVMGWPVGSLMLLNTQWNRPTEFGPWLVHFEFAPAREMQVFDAGIGEMVYDSADFVEVIERSGRVRFPTE